MRNMIKENSTGNTLETFELKDIYKDDVPIGITTLYIIATSEYVDFNELIAKNELDEIKVIIDECNYEDYFISRDKLYSLFKQNDIHEWSLKYYINGEDVTINGNINESTLTVVYPSDLEYNFTPLIKEAEKETWTFNNYNKELIRKMCVWFHSSTKQSIVTLQELSTRKPIYDEFLKCMSNDIFAFIPNGKSVSIHDITAKDLFTTYKINADKAYWYLVRLTDDYEKTMNELKNVEKREQQI